MLTEKTKHLMGISTSIKGGATGLSILDKFSEAQGYSDKIIDLFNNLDRYIQDINIYVTRNQSDPQYPIISTAYDNALDAVGKNFNDMMTSYGDMLVFLREFGKRIN